ncbi:hypothetical protein A9Q76_06770 [Arcobacter sp. 31_11_sub10_T18]|nr:hypothetical protein A9Q76_06770 [Arcobacter sp. 31_11_sub10_T18]
MLEIIDFVKESLFMILFVTFKINLLCDKKEKKKKLSEKRVDSSGNIKRKDDEDITLNKYLFQKENEYKKQGINKMEIEDKLSIDAKIWEKTHGSWHDSPK